EKANIIRSIGETIALISAIILAHVAVKMSGDDDSEDDLWDIDADKEQLASVILNIQNIETGLYAPYVRIPDDSGRAFRRKPATHSDAKRPLIPT
ncbi:MAG: hypothetical protein KKD56_06255, partial [Acidobacteria bacterium]|nr:hypothetical protein [Acidobacteriota bacterium]